jgi:hypothetical protein
MNLKAEDFNTSPLNLSIHNKRDSSVEKKRAHKRQVAR